LSDDDMLRLNRAILVFSDSPAELDGALLGLRRRQQDGVDH